MIVRILFAAALAGDATPPPAIASLERLRQQLHHAGIRIEQGGALDSGERAELRELAGAAGPLLAGEIDQWLVAEVRPGTLPALARLERRVRALTSASQTAASVAAASDGRARAELHRVLERREFRRARVGEASADDGADWWTTLLERLRRWLEKAKSDSEARQSSGSLPGGALVWALLAAVLVVLVFAALAALRERSSDSATRTVPAPASDGAGLAAEALARTSEQWLALAERCLAAGDSTGAVRALYLALLGGLDRRGAIEVRTSRTNWELAARLRRAWPAVAAPLDDLTRVFDRAVYGGISPGNGEFERARALAQQVLASVPVRNRESA